MKKRYKRLEKTLSVCEAQKEELGSEAMSLQEVIENDSNKTKRSYCLANEMKQEIEKEKDHAQILVAQAKE